MTIGERHHLAADIDTAISSIVWPGSYQEPDYVAKLVTILPGVIKHSLLSLFPARHISVGSAFIHQKPLAKFLNPPFLGMKNPELGDLLIVCRELWASGNVYNALLLQAKCTDDVFRTHIPADHQFILYSQWPEFEYVRAGHLNGTRRSASPKTITQGAQYLLIDKTNPSAMFTATVDIPLEGTSCFPLTLASVLAFDRGRTIQKNTPRDMWSNVICDLLKICSSAVFNRRKAGFNKTDRWSGDDAFNFLLHERIDDDTPGIGYEDENSVKSGMGVICVDLDTDRGQRKPLFE